MVVGLHSAEAITKLVDLETNESRDDDDHRPLRAA